MKGVELGTTKRMSEVIMEVGGVDVERVVVVSGPNLAKEIARKQPAASVVACRDQATAERVAAACATGYFRPYTNHDVVGTELGGAVKNVVALAVGMAEGMGMGDNTKASIITRGWPRRRGSVCASGPTRRPSWVWPGWATSSPRACLPCPATAPSARTSARGCPSPRSSR
jgi:hypothetical protein